GCSTGQSCCASTTTLSGSADGGALGFPNRTVVSCQTSCASGEIQLCVQDKECPAGRSCQFGSLASYCLPIVDGGADASRSDAASAPDAGDGSTLGDGAAGD
ncbi:MAG: hypothetical protein ACREJ3_12945, partial [Polyangiaceae bacterium]